MDAVQALAILSLGAFLTVLVTAVFYAFTVRPRLLEPVPLAALGALDADLRAELADQRASVEQLNAALAYHTEQLASAARAAPGGAPSGLSGVLDTQTETVAALVHLLNEQSDALARLDQRLASQDAKLDRLALRLEGRAASGPPGAGLEQLRQSVQAQAERLVEIGGRLDRWAATGTLLDRQLAEHARILAELDREMAAQAQAVHTLDAKVSEHTAMLVTAATERREQAGLLERLVNQMGLLVPLVSRVAARPVRPDQDRLTDIKGIGPVYAGKLYEAGIQTFRQLAAMTPEEVYTLIGEPKWRMRSIDARHWIEQARHLASQREKVEQIT